MKRKSGLAFIMFMLITGQALAASPIPTFDKEAATTTPYNRTGEQDVIVEQNVPDGAYQPGNTGTEQEPSFYVTKINLTGEPLRDSHGELAALLASYTNRSVKASELPQLTASLTEYARSLGYTVPQAVIPPQEVKNGQLEVKIYAAAYDSINITKNTTKVADRVAEDFTDYLRPGEVITDDKLEHAMNNLNDLPGVTARAILRPGTNPGTTALDIEMLRRPVWNNYVFIDNGGGYYSGRWRYGFNTEINNPGHQGDKIILNGMMTSHDVKNYGIRYEAPVGDHGTRFGVAYSQNSYDMWTNDLYESLGKSRGFSFYGLTPVYRDMRNRVTAIYGYDRRDITDEIRFNPKLQMPMNMSVDKKADVVHVGISGSQYNINQFTQYDLIYWYGDIDTDGGAYYDGGYHKLTGDLLNIWYDNKFNYRVSFQGQLANRALDGSEQFYLGGMNGVRAYGSSDGYGDYGYVASAEVRCKTDIEGLEAALFIDNGAAGNKALQSMEHLSGWGVGLRYAKDNEWYAQIDYARKISGRPDYVEPEDHNGRWWFQLYRMF